MHSYEKLGAFYLGRVHDLGRDETTDQAYLYDSRDLLTHALCVGMTGSGKTGLCIGLLEEAAIDGIPSLAIDPKGDLTNLLLTFPDLRPEDFRPWVSAEEAQRKGLSLDEYAARQANLWKEGLARWDQDGERLRRLRDAADFAVYTPGSDAGLPLSILSSFDAPPREIVEEGDLFRERISSTATALLGLLGIDADPVRSREHILLSTLFDSAWSKGDDLDLGRLIQLIQTPPVQRIGVLEVETFYPAKERFELAMALNQILAAPGFAGWLEGEPLDVDRLLWTEKGKPRVSVLSIAHLSETERMFFVALLLNQTLGWMRTRSGTTSLRALLYMDEIFGYVPPVAEPPSKKPLLTLLKQARAFGLGVVLATQNPVDLDYKGLSNIGTWFLGRLQTARDRERVLAGLEGAGAARSGGFDRKEMEALLAGLDKRVFLARNVHEPLPTVFHTRWALSYLRGPLTRDEVRKLMAERPRPEGAQEQPPAQAAPSAAHRPVLPPSVEQVFLRPLGRLQPGEVAVHYLPRLLGMGAVHFVDARKEIEAREEHALLVDLERSSGEADWEAAARIELGDEDLAREPFPGATFGEIPPRAAEGKAYRGWEKELDDHLYRTRRLELFRCEELDAVGRPGESERDLRIRLAEEARERRDHEVETLRKRYARKVRTQEDRILRARQRLDKETEQAESAKMQTFISFGAAALSAFLGKKRLSRGTLGRATTAARGLGRSRKEAQDIERAEATLEAAEQRLAEIEAELEAEIEEITGSLTPEALELDTIQVEPRRKDIDLERVALAWVPYRKDRLGILHPLFEENAGG